MTTSEYKPGVYVKGGQIRTADNAADAVALVFDGYRYQEPAAPKVETNDSEDGSEADEAVGDIPRAGDSASEPIAGPEPSIILDEDASPKPKPIFSQTPKPSAPKSSAPKTSKDNA